MKIEDIKVVAVGGLTNAIVRPMTEKEKSLTREDFDLFSEWCVHDWGLNRHTEECQCDICNSPRMTQEDHENESEYRRLLE